jgi:hypothetical protein
VSTSLINSTVAEEEVVLRWQVHLARNHPEKLAVIIAIVAATGVIACGWFNSVIPGALMAFVLFGALSDFLLPNSYRFTSTHASATTPLGKRIIAWTDVRRVYLDDEGVKLSPLDKQSRLEAYRGVYLRFGGRRDEVLETIKKLTHRDE